MLAGERLIATLAAEDSFDLDVVLAVYRASEACDGVGCDQEVACVDETRFNSEPLTYQADQDGWYTVVADCREEPPFSSRHYRLDVRLDCAQASCGCL